MSGERKFDLKTQAKICSLCPNMCRFLCPVSAVEKKETITPRGKGTLILDLDRGERELDAGMAEILYHCAGCEVCREHCPSRVDLPEVLGRHRARAAAEGLAPAAARNLAGRLERERSLHRPAGELAEGLGRYREMLSSQARVLYFAGCLAATLYPEVIGATLRLFEAAGVAVNMLEPEECCGLPLYTLGYHEEAAGFARNIQAAAKAGGYDTVVSGCPMCVRMMKEVYPALEAGLGVRVLHITEYLEEMAGRGDLAGLAETAAAGKEGSGAAPSRATGGDRGPGEDGPSASATVTYHDPCYLGRRLGVYHAPRRLLTEIAGLTLVEMENSREYAACCGGSTAVSTVAPETATAITGRRVGEALRTGAGTLVTACPHCLEMFGPACPEGLEVRDITEVLAERLGINPAR